ncbi:MULTISPECIES: CapA family protein [Salinibaculum]|uniref:CapA family protein n=1 Tax=Salinibaculum TaxID=2732368 RepID=UPI0030CA7B1F
MGWTRRAVLASGALALSGCSASLRAGPNTAQSTIGGGVDATVGFGGDAMLGRSVTDRWAGRDAAGVWGGLRSRLQSLDGFVCNLECCISEGGERWPDKVYYFRAAPDFAVPALEAAGTSCVSLANNHALDFGESALSDTLGHLDDAGIGAAGAGPDREAALEPAVVRAGEVTVAVVALTDQFRPYRAGLASPGTAYLRLDTGAERTLREVRSALSRAREADPDLVVASLHWGPNWVIAPDRTQQRLARWLVDRGVDVVHGHSAHVLQGVEVYRGRPILYDTADIVDDYVVKESLHNDRSALFELVVEDGQFAGVRVVPVVIEDETVGPTDGDAAEWVRDRVRTLSGEFGTPMERDGSALWIPLADR